MMALPGFLVCSTLCLGRISFSAVLFKAVVIVQAVRAATEEHLGCSMQHAI